MLNVTVLINIPKLTKDNFNVLINLVSLDKQKRIKRFRFEQDAYNCLLSDILARIEICRITGFNNRQLEFSTGKYGKPFLNNNPHVHYNISHTGHYIACVVSDQSVGVDIELIQSIDLTIAERFFAPDETAYVIKSESIHRFYEIWTKKESRIKWEGKGLHKSLPSFSVFDSGERESIFYHLIFDDGKAIGHVCSSKMEGPSIKILNTDMLLQDINKL